MIVKQFHLNIGVCIIVWLVNSMLEKETDETQIRICERQKSMVLQKGTKFYSRPQHVVTPIFPLAKGEQERESGLHEAQLFPFLRKTTQSMVGDLSLMSKPVPLAWHLNVKAHN